MTEEKNTLRNVTFAELTIGQSACLSRKLTQEDIALFAVVSGDVNPAHMNPDFCRKSFFHGVIGHGMWLNGLISTVLGTMLPGPGTIYLEQDIRFKRPVRIGDTITVRLNVKISTLKNLSWCWIATARMKKVKPSQKERQRCGLN